MIATTAATDATPVITRQDTAIRDKMLAMVRTIQHQDPVAPPFRSPDRKSIRPAWVDAMLPRLAPNQRVAFLEWVAQENGAARAQGREPVLPSIWAAPARPYSYEVNKGRVTAVLSSRVRITADGSVIIVGGDE